MSMAKKQMLFKTKGMNQDLSVSAFNPEFSFENMNLRLSTNEGNTLMSWVNERGTSEISIVTGKWNPEDKNDTTINEILGTPIGTAVINHKLVVFTTTETPTHTDRIYLLKFDDSKSNMLGRELYKGDINFQITNPLETLVSYESENIQKIYWVDGVNQPRVINIAKEDYNGKPNTFFDFIPTLQLKETVTVQKILGGNGTFAPGVIQYAFTYYNKYGQESNIFYTTPLYYLSHKDRGASPEDKVDNAFKITINTVDENFDYLRIYSIQRTSINGTPICKRIQDIEINDKLDWVDTYDHTKGHKASYTDLGTSGDSVDPTELLYKGGETIAVETIEQKDHTLFLGNLNIKRDSLLNIKNAIKSEFLISSSDSHCFKFPLTSTSDYVYGSQLSATDNNGNAIPCSGFKGGETYRLGVQFQHKSGKWSEPIYIGDYPMGGSNNWLHFTFSKDTNIGTMNVPCFVGTMPKYLGENIKEKDYVKARPLYVVPTPQDRDIICQGVLNPTLVKGSLDATQEQPSPGFIQSSWFFRPKVSEHEDGGVVDNGMMVSPSHKGNLNYTWRGTGNNETDIYLSPYKPEKEKIRTVEIQGDYEAENRFKILHQYSTLHSPDFVFDEQSFLIQFGKVNYNIVGYASFLKTFSDIDIQTETPTISGAGGGFIHKRTVNSRSFGIVSGLFYDDYLVDEDGDGEKIRSYPNEKASAKWLVYPWQENGSLNNDINRPTTAGVQSAKLKKKVISNLRYADSIWNKKSNSYPNTTPIIYFSEEGEIVKVDNRFYMGNVDTMLNPDNSDGSYFTFEGYMLIPQINKYVYSSKEVQFDSTNWWKTYSLSNTESSNQGLYHYDEDESKWIRLDFGDATGNIGDRFIDLVRKKEGVRMKYRSTPHLIMNTSTSIYNDAAPSGTYSVLPIVELIKTGSHIKYGGESSDALKENVWIPCGEAVTINNKGADGTELKWTYGDTYYQRWDCLKTYPFTREDVNQIVEIGSFMLETHINIDGRYDRNRGQISNINMSPQNFNLYNPVYSQTDNFFSYKIMDDDYYKNSRYPNQITWSKTKENGADVDLWTNITLASILELDGDKGEINKLIRFNNYLFAFQDSGIAQILYNDNVQISATNGVPIEIANSGKVSGKDYKSNTIGCSNKWSMTTTPNGIYFMDSNDKSIYLFNGQLQNVTSALGFNSWAKKEIPSMDVKWDPKSFDTFVSYFDKKNQDVMFINKNRALAYSEKLGAFTSFYDYGDTPFFCNLDDTGIWLRKDGSLWKHQGSNEYCKFFNVNKPYWMTLVGNPEPQLDKIFTNLEFRACVEGDGEQTNAGKFAFSLPFDSLETWNEYQHGITALSQKNGHSMFKHGGDDSALIRKFRIWRCDIPRDNYSGENTFDATFDNTFRNPRQTHSTDRMRNPWLYLKLMKMADTDKKTEIHDLVMTYFG